MLLLVVTTTSVTCPLKPSCFLNRRGAQKYYHRKPQLCKFLKGSKVLFLLSQSKYKLCKQSCALCCKLQRPPKCNIITVPESDHISIIKHMYISFVYVYNLIQTRFKIYLRLTFSVVAYVKLPNLIAISPLLTDLEERRGGKKTVEQLG